MAYDLAALGELAAIVVAGAVVIGAWVFLAWVAFSERHATPKGRETAREIREYQRRSRDA